MARIKKIDIIKAINEIENMLSHFIIVSFNLRKENTNEIVKVLSKAIDNNGDDIDRLNAFYDAIIECGYVFPKMIIEQLYFHKKLKENRYNFLLKWLEDAWALYNVYSMEMTKRELEALFKNSNYSITKQRIKNIMKIHRMLVNDLII